MKRFLSIIAILTLVQTALISNLGAQGVKPADFYRGKTVTIVIPSRAGNQHDLYARVSVPYLEKATGAQFVVRNEAGGRGIKAHNKIYSAKPDGLLIDWYQFLTLNVNEIFKNPAAKYKASEFSFISGLGREPHVCIVKPDGPYKSIQDLKAVKGGKFGSASKLGNYTLSTVAAAYLLDLDVRVVSGMSPNAIVLSMKQDELVGACFTASNAGNFAGRGLVEPLFVLDFERHPAFPDTPALVELIELKGEKLELLKLWNEKLNSTSAIYMAPGTPEDKLNYMRGIFNDIFNDPKLMKELEKIAGYSPLSRVTGKQLSATAQILAKDSAKIRKNYLALLDKYTIN